MQLVEDLGVVQRYRAIDSNGVPVVVLVLGEHASRDPRQRSTFADAVQGSVAALPGELPITCDAQAPRPWAASHSEPGAVGVERLLPRLLAPPAPQWAPPAQQQQHAWAASPPRPARPSKAPLLAALGGVTLLLVVALVTAVAVANRGNEVAAPVPTGTPEGLPPLPTDLPPLPSVDVPEPAPTLEGPRPELKDAPPISVLGPTFAPGDETYTFAFPGWPFAFRGPGTWGCLRATAPVPDSYAWGCIDEQDPGDRQRATVMIRRCPTTCTPAEQDEMNRAWLDEPDQATVFDPSTVYVESAPNDRGQYSVDFSHFFAAAPDEPLGWQVGVYVESTPETRDEVLKLLNEVRSQTP